MAYANNKFCWHGLVSTDVDRAKSFYTEVLGWSTITTQMGDEEATMFTVADIPRAHLMAPPMEGMPTHWNNYLRVEDVDATTAAAVANGGKILNPPTDIPPGRFSVVSSPSGAAVSLFRESDDSSQNAPAGDGSMHWVELHSKDTDADVRWMTETFGVTTETMPMPQGPYYIFNTDDGPLGGGMAAMNPEAPAFFLLWVEVSDVDGTVERIGQHGGQVFGPITEVEGVGRMAVGQDPTGGVFGVITPAPRG